MNNSPGNFPVSARVQIQGAACVRTEMNSLEKVANAWKIIPRKCFPVLNSSECEHRHRIYSRLRWAKSPIASVQRTQSTLASHSAIPRGMNATRMNANRLDSNRSAMNAGPMRTNFCVLGRRYERQRTLVIQIRSDNSR